MLLCSWKPRGSTPPPGVILSAFFTLEDSGTKGTSMKKTIVLLAVVGGVALAGCSAAADKPSSAQSSEAGRTAGKGTAAKSAPIKLVAKKAKATKSMLSTGHPLSCVKVMVVNQTKKKLEVNPMYFSLTDTAGAKHDASDALGQYEHEIDTTTLAPQEKVTGMVCGEGRFTPEIVAMTNPLFSEAARAKVA